MYKRQKYYNTWYYVENGELNWNFTGLTDYYGTKYYVENGVLNWDSVSYTHLDVYKRQVCAIFNVAAIRRILPKICGM